MSIVEICPEDASDRSAHLVGLVLAGYPQLAADTILNNETPGALVRIVGDAIRLLNFEFLGDSTKRRLAYQVLVEILLNLFGVESMRPGFSRKERKMTIGIIVETLRSWEVAERNESGGAGFAHSVIQEIVQNMKAVLMGRSMVAKLAENVMAELKQDALMESFISAMRRAIEQNIYYRIVTTGISKVGNDSATGLRMLRHLGAVQVSSNPVIAARAYEELPELWGNFEEVVKEHREWSDKSDEYEDEITAYATVISLLPNLLVFRPLAHLSDFRDGIVSYQLNPFLATSQENTVKDAMKIYSILGEILTKYDAHLLWNTHSEGGSRRPNLVYKVAACSPAAIETTKSLNAMGIGTNNTVTYTASQEVTLILAAIEGMSKALRRGIPITQAYETNMIGRLEDHLREYEAEKLLAKTLEGLGDKDQKLVSLAGQLRAFEDVKKASSFAQRMAVVCSKKYLRSLNQKAFADFLNQLNPKITRTRLSQLEQDIQHSGIFVTRRVYGIFFGRRNRSKWIAYIEQRFGVSHDDAEEILDKIDMLPASKRRAADTYLVLGSRAVRNLTNTEFPDQQLKVWQVSRQKGFRLATFQNSIVKAPDRHMLERLLRIEDFRRAYELTPDLLRTLQNVGIRGEFGDRGLEPDDWPAYGAVLKTMDEFKEAYANFRRKAVEFVSKVGAQTRES
jgi:transaldolase